MFGFGMSRGVDVDKNGYRDLAIGAPNSEKVYVFKTYPVIKIQPFLNSSKRIFSLHDTQVNFIVCFLYNRKVAINFTVEIDYTLSVDLELKRKRRTSFKSDFNETILTIYKTINVTSSKQCMEHVAFINASVSNSSIKAELTYDLSKKVSQKDTEFCKDCVVLKPEDIKPVIYEIPFVEACEHCKADLEVTAKVINIT